MSRRRSRGGVRATPATQAADVVFDFRSADSNAKACSLYQFGLPLWSSGQGAIRHTAAVVRRSIRGLNDAYIDELVAALAAELARIAGQPA
ncbi:hypothetical protein B0G80_5230 [Paraburkholderia sp. BL6669N2]|nr:hypothetical protein B0G80_5230 [Paraburkholderia sp. BL6669N2]